MKRRRILSYGFSHHLFHQANELYRRFPDYQAVTSSFVPQTRVKFAERFSKSTASFLSRRSHPLLPRDAVKTYPTEQIRQLASRILKQPYSFFSAHDRMAQRIVRDFEPPEILLAIDTGAESLFNAWAGETFRILDLSIAVPQYRQKIFSEAAADPAQLGVDFHFPGEWELRRYATEVLAADLVLCPSEFVKDSCLFVGVPESRLRVLPYGFDPGRFAPPQNVPAELPDRPLTLVFAGTFCHRKGSHLLLPAFGALRSTHPTAELHIYGEILDAAESIPAGVTFHGRVPQATLAERFQAADVMVFPTLFEGSAYVVYQALACGLPVITTRNCGSVVNQSCGLILEEINESALVAAMRDTADNHAAWRERGRRAADHVREFSWQHYGDRLEAILRPLLN